MGCSPEYCLYCDSRVPYEVDEDCDWLYVRLRKAGLPPPLASKIAKKFTFTHFCCNKLVEKDEKSRHAYWVQKLKKLKTDNQ